MTSWSEQSAKAVRLVLWCNDLYQQESVRQLSETTFFYTKDLTSANESIVKETIQKLITEQELPITIQNLIITTPRTSCLYSKPKIHEPDYSGRPSVSACSWPTELIYLDKIMTPTVKSPPFHILDSNHVLEIFPTFNFSGKKKSFSLWT